MRGAKDRPRRIARSRGVPPVMLRDRGARLDGQRILEESPGDLGLLLWRTARDVALWAMTPEDGRAGLFADGTAGARLALVTATELPAMLSAPVDTLHAMLSEPDRADADIVMICCLEVAAWARSAGRPHTAAAFAQAGAMAAPASGDAALFAGVCARGAGQPGRAWGWLRQAVTVAREEQNWPACASALVELGALKESRGKLLRAERFYRRAMRAAGRHGERGERMRAAHGLFRLARQQGDQASAAQFALSAQRAFEPDAPGAADLLLDLARFWTDVGEVARARGAAAPRSCAADDGSRRATCGVRADGAGACRAGASAVRCSGVAGRLEPAGQPRAS